MKFFEVQSEGNKFTIKFFGFPFLYHRENSLESYTRFLFMKFKTKKDVIKKKIHVETLEQQENRGAVDSDTELVPDVSVIIPVFNAGKYIKDCLDSLKIQSDRNLEFILVDDESSDNSVEICHQYANEDKRFRIISVAHNIGVAAARNLGLSIARGKYIGFVDPDDIIHKDFFAKLYRKARIYKADIVINTNIKRIDCDNNITGNKNAGIGTVTTNISTRDRMRIALTTGITWNKIYRFDFLKEKQILFPEIKTMGTDNLVTWLSLMYADRIISFEGEPYYYRENPVSIIRKKKDETYYKLIDVYERIHQRIKMSDIPRNTKRLWLKALRNRIINDSISNLRGFEKEEQQIEFVNYVKETFPDIEIKRDIFPLISLTSYPARIKTLSKVVQSLKKQNVQFKKIVLWLAESQFPNKILDLPEDLTSLIDEKFEIRWTERDIRSYKKLIPALIDFPNDIIVTADDDIIYPADWLDRLVRSYQDNPNVIHCLRGRNIRTEESEILPYSKWRLINSPLFEDFNILLTGAGGCLYRRDLLDPEILDVAKFTSICPDADDIWFWGMAVKKGTKIKVARPPLTKLNEIDSTQDSALWSKNKTHNDVVIEQFLKNYPEVKSKILKH